jgi:hypothetical protein
MLRRYDDEDARTQGDSGAEGEKPTSLQNPSSFLTLRRPSWVRISTPRPSDLRT